MGVKTATVVNSFDQGLPANTRLAQHGHMSGKPKLSSQTWGRMGDFAAEMGLLKRGWRLEAQQPSSQVVSGLLER